MYKKQAIETLVGEVLDGTELELRVDSYTLEDDLESGQARIHCQVHDARTGEKKVIDASGVGIVDAFFHGLVDMYANEFPSLATIRVTDFSIAADLDTAKKNARTDSHAEVTLRVENANGHEYVFTNSSPSLTRSSIFAVLQSTEFFINSERAFIEVTRALRHAREENRADSVARYTQMLTTLVEATSYTEVIEQIRKENDR